LSTVQLKWLGWAARLLKESMMEARLNYASVAPEPVKAMYGLGGYLVHCSIEPALQELIKMRVSQINGCAYCLDMHSQDARAAGETEQRLYALNAWRETPFYSDRERAALAWAEHVTRISDGISDELYQATRQQFSEQEIADLTWATVAINSWNRIAISFRAVPGQYKPRTRT
jgi:AhpD family alkylhydroperoxidase